MEIVSNFNNIVEIIGAVLSLVYLFFSIKKSIWLWPLGLLASSFYIVVYYYSKLYAEMGLQVYYIVISIFGWYYWIFGKSKGNETDLPITKLKLNNTVTYFVAFLLLYLSLYILLKNFTDSPIPGWDSLATAISLVATWMLAKKILENWILWIVADAMCIAISLYKELYFTAILFIVYTVMAFFGYLNWKKSMKNVSN